MPRIVVEEEDLQVQLPGAFYQSLPARLLQNNLDVSALRTNTLLHKDEWELLDGRVVAVASNVLNAIADLRALGLTTPLGGLGVLVSQYEQVSDMSEANVNMAVEVDDEEDRINFPLIGVPVPIISKGFRIDARSLAATRRNGGALDTTHVDTATRKVAEKLEELFFLGSAIVQRGQAIYGILTHPSRNTVSGSTWGTATNIYPNVLAMIGAQTADNFYGPYRLYLNSAQYMESMALTANTSQSILSTIQQLPGLTAPNSIRPSNYVPDGQAALVNMSSDVVDLAIGQDIVPVEWETKGGLVTHYKVLAAMIPRIKADANGRSGIVHISGI